MRRNMPRAGFLEERRIEDRKMGMGIKEEWKEDGDSMKINCFKFSSIMSNESTLCF
jgi:hypothetical protein